MSIVSEVPEKRIRMAHLATVGAHSINGVAALHTELLEANVLHDFYEMWPERFNNKTNGVTPRRWLLECNPRLSNEITARIGDDWPRHLDTLEKLRPIVEKREVRDRLRKIQARQQGRPGRLHQRGPRHYDRRRLDVRRHGEAPARIQNASTSNVLHIVTRYLRLKNNSAARGRATHFHLRRQGGPRIRHGEAHHQADQRGGGRRQTTIPTSTAVTSGLPAELSRVAGGTQSSPRRTSPNRSRPRARKRPARQT